MTRGSEAQVEAPRPAGRPRALFSSYTAEWTGPSNSLVLLLRGLRDRFEPEVLLPGTGRLVEELAAAGIPHHSLPALDKWAIPRVARLVREGRFDLVYGNNTHASSRTAFAAAWLARVPFVCHVRGMGWEKGWTRLWYLRRAAAVVAVSRAAAASVARFVRPERLHVVHNGVPLDRDAPPREACRRDVRRELGLPDDALLLLAVSHLNVRKGQAHAVAAMPRVAEAEPRAHLLLAGSPTREPDYTRRLELQVEELGLRSRVHVLGFQKDVDRLLAAADVFVHTALADPHPRAVLEAMAAKLPVAAFAVDGVAETVVHDETGHLVEPGDEAGLAEALVALLASPEDRVALGRAGRRRVEEHFSEEVTTRRVGDILDDVLDGRGRR